MTSPRRGQGKAFVEVVASTDRFEEELDRSLTKAVKEASKAKNFEPLVKSAGEAGGRAGDEFATRFRRDANGKLRDERGRFVRENASTFAGAGVKLGVSFGAAFVEGFATLATKAGSTLGLGFLSGAGGVLSSLAAAGPVGIAVGIGAIVAAFAALVAIGPLVLSVFFAIGGALFSLLGLINAVPAAIGVLIAIIAPLVLAFQGFGDVISALAEGDLEKFNEGLKKLSPSARGVAREIQRLMPFFRELKGAVQEAFFAQFQGSLTRVAKALGPALSGGLQNVAAALGQFVGKLAALAAKPKTQEMLFNLLSTTASIIDRAGPGIIKFLESFGNAINAALPSLGKFGDDIGKAFGDFGAFIDRSIKDGSFQAFLDTSWETLKDIGVVLLEVLGLFKDMFATADESGQTFLQDVAEAVKRLREFFQSPEGKEFLENMIKLAEDFGDIMIIIVGIMADLFRQIAVAIELADRLGNAIDRILGKAQKFREGNVGRALSGVLGMLPSFAEGGITSGPSLAGEAGPEAILPLDNPARARQVAAEANLGDLIGGGTTIVWVTIDGQQLQGRIDRTVQTNNRTVGRQLSNGPRMLVAR